MQSVRGAFIRRTIDGGSQRLFFRAPISLPQEKEFAAGLKNRAEQYLAEGIDGDEDGEYAERSTEIIMQW